MIIWTGGPDTPPPRMTARAIARYWAEVALVGSVLWAMYVIAWGLS